MTLEATSPGKQVDKSGGIFSVVPTKGEKQKWLEIIGEENDQVGLNFWRSLLVRWSVLRYTHTHTHSGISLLRAHKTHLKLQLLIPIITHSILSSSLWFLKYREHIFHFVPWSSPPQEHARKFFGYVWQAMEDAGWHSAYPVISTINIVPKTFAFCKITLPK